MWAQLQDQIKIRTKRLASAAEIHGFNRDLNELIARLQEKDASLSMEDLGRDMASVKLFKHVVTAVALHNEYGLSTHDS